MITVVLCLIAAGNSELHLYSPESLTWAGCTEECFQELNRTVFTGVYESRDLKYVNNVKLLLSKYSFIQITQTYNQYIHRIFKTSVNERWEEIFSLFLLCLTFKAFNKRVCTHTFFSSNRGIRHILKIKSSLF